MNKILEAYYRSGLALFNNQLNTNKDGYQSIDEIPDELDINEDPILITKICDIESKLLKKNKSNYGSCSSKGIKNDKLIKECTQSKKNKVNTEKSKDIKENTR